VFYYIVLYIAQKKRRSAKVAKK